jgi:exopolyphosphatase / guanosine-5'-triphosphate,3'-diphosphate pyrophosphatase
MKRKKTIQQRKRSILDEKRVRAQVLAFAERFHFEKKHSCVVTQISLALFDELVRLHRLTDEERILLEAGSLLHDIGRTNGGVSHNKRACDSIMKANELPFSKKGKIIVALIARYHRGVFPMITHRYYNSLDQTSRNVVKKLAALVRFADGLDRSRSAQIRNITCKIMPTKIMIQLQAKKFSELDNEAGLFKSDLFQKIYKRRVVLIWQQI